MAQRIQKARSREEFERDERLASETLGGGGNRRNPGTNVAGAGGRRNVGPGAHNTEQQDYDEENLGMLGGSKETGETETIQAGTYEDDYGVGVQGRREQGQVGETKDPEKDVLKRQDATVGGRTDDGEDFPTGKWSRQQARARLASAPGVAKGTNDAPRRKNGATVPRRTGKTGSSRERKADANGRSSSGIAGKTRTESGRSDSPRATRTRPAGSKQREAPREAASTRGTPRRKTGGNRGG